jgi:hypothetical protein
VSSSATVNNFVRTVKKDFGIESWIACSLEMNNKKLKAIKSLEDQSVKNNAQLVFISSEQPVREEPRDEDYKQLKVRGLNLVCLSVTIVDILIFLERFAHSSVFDQSAQICRFVRNPRQGFQD